jgi:hypothetical protein
LFIVTLIVTDASYKRRWVNIRHKFKKSLNRRKTKSGQAADSNAKRYKYEEVLQFLMPHIHERSTISSIEQPSENDSDMANSRIMASTDDERREKSVQVTGMLISNPKTHEEEDRSA